MLTHICLLDPSILFYWTSPFPILGVSGILFHFYSISNRYSCLKQTVKTLIRWRILLHLIWVCTVYLCPKNGTLILYGLNTKHHHQNLFKTLISGSETKSVLESKPGYIQSELYKWATSLENLFMQYAKNKGADQPAHPRSLISTFVVRCLDSIISLVSIYEISSLYLASAAV